MNINDISYEEYMELAALLPNSHEGNGARKWLSTSIKFDAGNTYSRKVMGLPLDQMPLYINDVAFSVSTIAKWRLKIAR